MANPYDTTPCVFTPAGSGYCFVPASWVGFRPPDDWNLWGMWWQSLRGLTLRPLAYLEDPRYAQ